MRRLVLLVLAASALAAGCAGGSTRASNGAEPAADGSVRDIDNVLTLRAAFNAERGKPRLLLLLSPTWGVCLAGASWVRDNILEKHPRAELAVYVVWLPMLGPDARGAIDSGLLGDPRVKQFWDEERVVGRWLADTGVGDVGPTSVVWDAYYVFEPGAAWNDRPGPVRSAATPVISSTGRLEQALAPLLR